MLQIVIGNDCRMRDVEKLTETQNQSKLETFRVL